MFCFALCGELDLEGAMYQEWIKYYHHNVIIIRQEDNIKWIVKKVGWQSNDWINLLQFSGWVMHQQINIQQLYVLPTLYLCVLYLSENKQRLVPLTA